MSETEPKSVFAAHGDHVIWIGRSDAPSADEWTSFVALVKETGDRLKPSGRPVAIMVLTDGCAPTSPQRSQLFDSTQGIEIVAAVISTNLMMRGIVTVLSWFQVQSRFFLPRDVHAGFDFLHVPKKARQEMWKRVQQSQAEIPNGNIKAIVDTTPFVSQADQSLSA